MEGPAGAEGGAGKRAFQGLNIEGHGAGGLFVFFWFGCCSWLLHPKSSTLPLERGERAGRDQSNCGKSMHPPGTTTTSTSAFDGAGKPGP